VLARPHQKLGVVGVSAIDVVPPGLAVGLAPLGVQAGDAINLGLLGEQSQQGGLMLADGLPQLGRHGVQRPGDQSVALDPKPNPMPAKFGQNGFGIHSSSPSSRECLSSVTNVTLVTKFACGGFCHKH
jgi:hypothetical protein